MKILMFGWEFPPHISGGLGTACYGLTKGLSELPDTEVIFVVPKAYGDEDESTIRLVGANRVPLVEREFRFQSGDSVMEYLEVDAPVIPYVTEEQFWEIKKKRYPKNARFVATDEGACIDFNGGYGPGLFQEIKNYALVARFIARKKQFDIIHAHDWLAYPAGIAASEESGKPLVIHVHATEFDRSGGNVNPRVYAIEREGMEQADRIITVSNFTRQTVIEKYGIDPRKVVTVYNAVEPIGNETANLPQKGSNEKIVTFLGRVTLQKGPGYFIEAARLVARNLRNVRFVMAGNGDMYEQMISRVAQLGLADRFHFTGFLNETGVHHLLRITDVFVMPSISEPFGIVPLEAMQFRVPVIISHQSGVSEVIKHAIKVDFWDTYAMADAIYGLLNYPSLAEHFKQAGKEEVDGIRWINAAKIVRDVYQTVLQGMRVGAV